MQEIIGNSSKEWCTVDPECDYANSLEPYSVTIPHLSRGLLFFNGSNFTNSSCALPLCVLMLSYTFENTHVRVYDMVLLILSACFLLFLLLQVVSTIRKLHGTVLLFRILYFMVFVIPVVSCIYCIVSMIFAYNNIATKMIHVVLSGSILMTELSVVVFGLFFKFYGNNPFKLALTLTIIFSVAIVFIIVEGVMEFYRPIKLPCSEFGFFTHGGMIFLFSTSVIFTFAYFATYIVYLFGCNTRWNLPSKKSFYRYALFLSLVNFLQSSGSLMWILGNNDQQIGNTGICLTLATNVIYITTFPPVVFWIFLRNYLRMNKDLKDASNSARTHINISSKETATGSFFKSWSFSKPMKVGITRNNFPVYPSILDGSYGSSSSYGSLNDEETFTKRLTPPEM